jgi:methionyl-tRNA synthetase
MVAEVYGDVVDAWSDTQPSVALEATWRIIRATNDYLQTNEPWKMEPGPACDAVMGDALEALRIVAVLASPAMPTACDAIWRRIGLSGSVLDQRLPAAAQWGSYPGGLPVKAAEPLFPRLKG